MDTITQGILGAAASQAVMTRRLPRGAGLIGAIGGMLPDLDIFIRSSSDPTVSMFFHRHFTHSLIFIPIGGMIAALPFLWMERFKNQKKDVILAAILGYATHGLLDLFTSYGTQLYWPFSHHRVSLDWIAIVDPIYTLILAVGIFLTARSKGMRPARLALLFSTLYIFFGGWQHHRAIEAQTQLAVMRKQSIERARVFPAPGSLLLWHSLYQANGRFYADGIRIPWFGPSLILPGQSTDATSYEELPLKAQMNPETMRRVQIFYWFADGFIAPVAEGSNAIGDLRYTISTENLAPLWGLQFDPETGMATQWSASRINRDNYRRLLREIVLGDPRYKSLKSLRVTSD